MHAPLTSLGLASSLALLAARARPASTSEDTPNQDTYGAPPNPEGVSPRSASMLEVAAQMLSRPMPTTALAPSAPSQGREPGDASEIDRVESEEEDSASNDLAIRLRIDAETPRATAPETTHEGFIAEPPSTPLPPPAQPTEDTVARMLPPDLGDAEVRPTQPVTPTASTPATLHSYDTWGMPTIGETGSASDPARQTSDDEESPGAADLSDTTPSPHWADNMSVPVPLPTTALHPPQDGPLAHPEPSRDGSPSSEFDPLRLTSADRTATGPTATDGTPSTLHVDMATLVPSAPIDGTSLHNDGSEAPHGSGFPSGFGVPVAVPLLAEPTYGYSAFKEEEEKARREEILAQRLDEEEEKKSSPDIEAIVFPRTFEIEDVGPLDEIPAPEDGLHRFDPNRYLNFDSSNDDVHVADPGGAPRHHTLSGPEALRALRELSVFRDTV